MPRAIHVGLGGQGHNWANVCRRHPEVEVVAFVEPAEPMIAIAVEKLQIPGERIYPMLAAAASANRADFVIDITPPAVHAKVAEEAFSLGMHYVGEKPMSDDFEAARRAGATAEGAGRTMMVAQNYRFGAVPRTTRRIVAEGRIGLPEVAGVGFYREWALAPGTHYVVMRIHHVDENKPSLVPQRFPYFPKAYIGYGRCVEVYGKAPKCSHAGCKNVCNEPPPPLYARPAARPPRGCAVPPRP